MKKTLITQMPEDLPKEIKNFISDAPIYDSSSSPEARVYFVDKDEGYYLKRAFRDISINRRKKYSSSGYP